MYIYFVCMHGAEHENVLWECPGEALGDKYSDFDKLIT